MVLIFLYTLRTLREDNAGCIILTTSIKIHFEGFAFNNKKIHVFSQDDKDNNNIPSKFPCKKGSNPKKG
jgi:hypothetical protein